MGGQFGYLPAAAGTALMELKWIQRFPDLARLYQFPGSAEQAHAARTVQALTKAPTILA